MVDFPMGTSRYQCVTNLTVDEIRRFFVMGANVFVSFYKKQAYNFLR